MIRRAPLALFLAIADAALAFSFRSPIAWALIVVPAAAMFVRPPHVPRRLATALTWLVWVLIVAVAARASAVGGPAGLALSVLAGLFLSDETAFPAGSAFLPAAFGVFLAAASSPSAPHFTLLAWLATAVLAFWLVVAMPAASARRRMVTIAIVAVPAGLIGQGLIVLLPWAQPRIEEATNGFIYPEAAETGLSIGGRLGDVQQLAQSRRIVLRMWSADPMDLRAGVYTEFDGRGWRPARVVPRSHAAPAIPAGPSTAVARFVVEQATPGAMPSPPNVDGVDVLDGGGQQISVDRFDLVHALPLAPDRYAVAFRPGPLRAAAGDDDVVRECLQVPASIDPRVRELAGQLGADSATARDKIDRTLSHLQARCRYSLDVGAFTTKDPLAEFLFDKKKGYCEYFASATVMLLRLQGVPARYVNGLSVRDADRRADHFVVRASDAHAWAEALVPGQGWVEVDSTPPGDYAALHESGHAWFEDAFEAIKSWSMTKSGLQLFGALVLAMLAAVAGIVVLRRFWRERRRRPAPPAAPIPLGVRPELAAALRRIEAIWTRAGCPRPSHRALLEHVAALPVDRISPELRELSVQVVQRVYRSAYGGEDIALEEIARLEKSLPSAS